MVLSFSTHPFPDINGCVPKPFKDELQTQSLFQKVGRIINALMMLTTALSQMENLMCTCGLMSCVCVSVKSTRPSGIPFVILGFRRPLCALELHFCRAHSGASVAADFYLTVEAALRHKSVDSVEDPKGVGCHLGQGLHRQLTIV